MVGAAVAGAAVVGIDAGEFGSPPHTDAAASGAD